MRINKSNLHSTSKEQKEKCRQFYLKTNIKQAKLGIIIFLLPFLSFLINDYFLFGVSLSLAAILAIRMVMITTCLLAVFNLGKITKPVSYDRLLLFTCSILLLCGGIIHFFRPENFVAQAIVTSVSIFVVYLVIPFRFQYQLLLGTTATIGESAIILYTATPTDSVTFTIISSLLFANFVAAFSSWQLHEYSRHALVEYQERIKIQEDLEKSNQNLEAVIAEKTVELKKTERLAAIGSTASMVGHDLRNPLTAIKGASYYINKNYGGQIDAKGKDMLELIQKNVQFSDKIINDLLDYSREIRLDTTQIDPLSIVEEAVAILNVPSNVQIDYQATENQEVNADFDKMKRVFINLIKNAIDAMPNGGQLSIKTQFDGGEAKISFSDTGQGISEENQKNLFQPLFTTKAKGMGFGLAICQRIVEAHNGKITIQSILGKGTTIIVQLPTKP
ncbi:MAG: sensor histidine kinase [Candidatus Bathyarchaeia archaeon]|jgi:signal transduction histidine kinase